MPDGTGGSSARSAYRSCRLLTGLASWKNISFALKRDLLAEACHAAGRDVSILTCSANVGVAWSEADLHRQYGRRADELRDAILMGSPSQMHDLIGRYRDAGADQVNISIRATRDRRHNDSAYDLDRLSCLAGICRYEVY